MKKKTNEIIIFLYYLAFIFCIGILIYGIHFFWVGFHNIDICHNEEIISLTLDVDIKETKISGEIWSLGDCYLSGLNTLIKGFYISILGSFLVGLLLKGQKEIT